MVNPVLDRYKLKINIPFLIAISGSYLVVHFFLYQYGQHIDSFDYFEAFSEAITFFCLALTASVVFSESFTTGPYRLALIGLLLLCISMATDSLDEWYKLNGPVSVIFESVSRLAGFFVLLMGMLKAGRENSQLIVALQKAAEIDHLTKLSNRRRLMEDWIIEKARSDRERIPLSMISIDVDHFKSINDTYGHNTGDEVLKKLAQLFKQNIRLTDHLARMGGEEFEVIQGNTSLQESALFAERIRAIVANEDFSSVHPGLKNVTVSIGVASYVKGEDYSKIRKRSDCSLYKAKNNGRNKTFVALKQDDNDAVECIAYDDWIESRPTNND